MASDGMRPVVTVLALYGAGGSVVGPRLAERLGVPFLDRRIPTDVAEETGLSENAVTSVDDDPSSGMERLASTIGRASTISGGGAPQDHLDLQERRIRSYIEEFLARATISGGVVLGRGGMIVLHNSMSALHVYLRGSREARLRQAMAIEGVDRKTAEKRQEAEDKTRTEYVRRAYGVDGEDPSLYHLILDSTELDFDVCVELIAAASQARIRNALATAEGE